MDGEKQNPFYNVGCVQVQRNQEIAFPSPDSDRGIVIRCDDFKRLKRSLTNASAPPKDYSALASGLLCFSGSAWLSLIPLAITKGLPAWVLPSDIALAGASLLCGIFVIFLGRDQRKSRKTMMSDLLENFTEIENRYRFPLGPTQVRQIIKASEHELRNEKVLKDC